MEDQCASVCYPIVKPLLKYFEKCQEKDNQNLQLHEKLSTLQDDVVRNNRKYEELLEEKISLKDLIATQIEVINKLEYELNESKSKNDEEQTKYNELEKNFKTMVEKFEDFLKQSRANRVKLPNLGRALGSS